MKIKEIFFFFIKLLKNYLSVLKIYFNLDESIKAIFENMKLMVK
jgi:hypothetical protein